MRLKPRINPIGRTQVHWTRANKGRRGLIVTCLRNHFSVLASCRRAADGLPTGCRRADGIRWRPARNRNRSLSRNRSAKALRKQKGRPDWPTGRPCDRGARSMRKSNRPPGDSSTVAQNQFKFIFASGTAPAVARLLRVGVTKRRAKASASAARRLVGRRGWNLIPTLKRRLAAGVQSAADLHTGAQLMPAGRPVRRRSRSLQRERECRVAHS